MGKTWLVRELGRQFSSYVEVNLEESPELMIYFQEHRGDPQKLIQKLQASLNKKITLKETLLFIDEIQECPDAILSLRYFKEKMPDLHVIAAGSLIEFALNEISFPVGRVDFMHVFPMNFTEYLQAANLESFAEIIQDQPIALDQLIHEKIMNEFKTYTLLGGLPEVISTYLEEKDLGQAQSIQQSLVANYRSDFAKYASKAQVNYIKSVFDSIPRQLGGKFIFAKASSESKSRDLNTGLQLLQDAQLAYKCHHSSGNSLPLGAEINESKFKVYFVDTGLCHRILGLQLNQQFLNEFIQFGGICENVVVQEIFAKTPPNTEPLIYYWHREEKSSGAEVDLLLDRQGEILPIEVKRGSGGRRKSLSLFCEEKKAKVAYMVADHPFEVGSINNRKTKLITLPYYFSSSLMESLTEK